MHSRLFSGPILALTILISTLTSVAAYRPTQFCKHRGENGKAEMCFAVNHWYNETTQKTDLYITLNTWRFESSAKGWASVAVGKMMTASLMFIVYGDPSQGDMTTVVRSANGHHPPLSIEDPSVYVGPMPQIEIQRSQFVKYEGEYFNDKLRLKPTHVGISQIVVYSAEEWAGFPFRNDTTAQEMVWSTNSWQDFKGDFSAERGIEMHSFGLGFGFLWVDMANAGIVTQEPFWPVVQEMKGALGMNEYTGPEPPTEMELSDGLRIEEAGGKVIDSAAGEKQDATPTDFAEITSHSTTVIPAPTATAAADDGTKLSDTVTDPGDKPQEDDTVTPPPSSDASDDTPIYPAPTFRGKTIREWMWHLHGLFMSLAFLIGYPFGASFIRSSRPHAFNLHWTTNAIATVLVFVGAVIGIWQSSGFSVAHQFLGFAVCGMLAIQITLGWQHHKRYLVVQRKTWFSGIHVYLGRITLAAGMVNLVFGVLLGGYGRAPIVMLVVAELVVCVVLAYLLGKDRIRELSGQGNQGAKSRKPLGQEAEEYFQLTGGEDEDEDEFGSDIDGPEDVEDRKQDREERAERAKKLRALDKV